MKALAISITVIVMFAILCCSLISAAPLSEEESGAVYNERNWDVRVERDKITQHLKVNLTVLNKRGEDYSSISFGESGFYKITQLKARLIDSNGKTVLERDKGDFTKACGYDNVSIYTDHCVYYTTLSLAQYPYTIEYELTRQYNSLFFWPSAVLQRGIPVKHAKYSLTVPADLDFSYKPYNTDIEPVISSPGDRTRVYTWEAQDLTALEDVDYVPAWENEPAMIRFAANRFKFEGYQFESGTWRSYGLWDKHLSDDRYCEYRLIDDLSFSPGQPRSILEAVYDHVADNVRYVSIAIGIGGWQPHHAKKTFERGFGDCKDVATLLISELRNFNIKAYPALVLTRSEGQVDVDFPDNYFNHVIAVAIIGSDTVWMDPTCENCRYDQLPNGDQDIPALVVTSDGGHLRRTPAAAAEDNQRVRTTHWSIRDDLYAEISSVMTATGDYAWYLRGSIPGLDSDETRRFVNRRFRGAEKKYEILSYEIKNLDSLHLPVEIFIEAKTLKPCRTVGSVVYFNPFVMNTLSDLEETKLSDRQFSLNLFYPFIHEDHISVTWDESLAVDSVVIPGCDSLSFSGGGFSLDCSRKESEIFITVHKAYDVYAISPDQFEEFKQYRKKVKKAVSQHIKFCGE